MFILCATQTVKEGEEEAVVAAAREMVKLSRQEPGTLLYVYQRSLENPRQFMFYEQYKDEAAFKAHAETPYFKKYVLETIVPRLESRGRSTWTEVPPAP